MRKLFAVALVLLALFSAPDSGSSTTSPSSASIMGDVNCSGAADALDSLQILRSAAGLSVNADCFDTAGDTDCDADRDAVDALNILRYVAGLPVAQPPACTPIGEELGPPGPLEPEELAQRLHDATTRQQVESLLRSIYPELGVGLYTEEGDQVLAGAETGPDDFYLYTFESSLLARAFLEGVPAPVDLLADRLSQLGVGNLETSGPVSGEELLEVLATAVARGRGDDSLYTLRLIDALGLERDDPLDLIAAGDDPALVILDPVQQFLALYDILAGLEAGAEPVAAAAARLKQSSADKCGFMAPVQVPRKGGKILSGSEMGAVLDIQDRLTQMHLDLLKYGYGATLEPPIAATHWKHLPGDESSDLHFTLTVRFDLGPLRTDVECGRLMGFSFPQDGPAAGVQIDWKLLGRPIQLDFTEALFLTPTDGAGKATADLITRVEERPGEGEVRTRNYFLSSIIRVPVPPGLGLDPGTIVLPLKQAQVIVERHEDCPIVLPPPRAVGTGRSPQGVLSPDFQLPCSFQGTATAIYTENNPIGQLTTTVTATNVRFEIDPSAITPPSYVVYSAVSGTVSWTTTGNAIPDCTISGSGTYSAAGNNTSPDPLARNAYIYLWDDGGGAPRYEGAGGLRDGSIPMAQYTCSEASFESIALGAGEWLYIPMDEIFRLEADGDMTGSYTTSVGPEGQQTTYTWDFTADLVCPSSADDANPTPDATINRASSGTC